jgi:hypothetical protein
MVIVEHFPSVYKRDVASYEVKQATVETTHDGCLGDIDQRGSIFSLIARIFIFLCPITQIKTATTTLYCLALGAFQEVIKKWCLTPIYPGCMTAQLAPIATCADSLRQWLRLLLWTTVSA